MKLLTDSSVINLGKYFYKLAERSRDVFWIRDVDYRTQLYISPAYETVWGRTCESLYDDSVTWFATIHPDDREKIEQDITRVKNNPQEGQSHSLEYRITRSDQDIRRIQEIFFPLYDTNHQFIGFAGIAKDVTQEKLRLAELEQASRFFRFFSEKVMLEAFGCRVDIVDNGQKVLEKITDLASYDIIFMDVGLPDISGYEIVSRLRQEPALEEMPIIAMTAHILDRDRQQAFDVGMNRIVAKPISYDQLAVVLEEYAKKTNHVIASEPRLKGIPG